MRKLFLLLVCSMLCAGMASAQKKDKTKTFYRNTLILAYTNCVFEDENVKLEMYDQKLWATNKTKKTLFIDMAQCFVTHNGSSRPIFAKDQDERWASKKGVTSEDLYITIAPSIGSKQNETFICDLSTGIYGKYSTTETPWGDFTDYDKRMFELINEIIVESQSADPKGKECLGTVSRHLLEDESINNIGASIAYAFNKKAEEWTTVSLSSWVSDVIFTPYYIVIPEELKKKEKKGFGVKEVKPVEIHVRANSPFEFDSEKSPLIVCDWIGNYKKGTFQLGTTKVKKAAKVGLLLNIATYGMASAAAKANADYHKDVIMFDGTDTNWGKMTYVSSISQTGQTK